MPTQLETLVKILKLERQQGGRDAAVEGGLSAYCKIWEPKARQQARRPVHQILIDEIVDSLADYGRIESEDDRLHKIGYLLERIMNRRPPPETYQARLADWEAKMTPRPSKSPPAARPNRPDKRRPSSSTSTFIEEHGAWDKDYAAGPEDHRLDVKPLPRLSRPPRAAQRQRGPDEERALQEDLARPTTAVKGIGGQLADLLKGMDLHTVRGLLWNFPRDYKDYTKLKCIKDLSPNSIETVIATVRRAHVAVGKNRRKDLLIEVEDGSGRLSVRFFGQHFLRPQLRPGKQIVMSGKVAIYRNMLQMANPEWEYLDVENLHTTGIVPIYRMTKGLKPRLFRRVMKELADEWAAKLPDPVPRTVLERCELADLGWAVQQSHFPEGWDHLHHARRRITFDELLMLQLAMLGKRREWQSVAGPALMVEDDFLESFISEAFPFELTGAQWRVIAEIRRDVAQMIPMNRLIQGDVGSGKTAVAAVAMAMALANNKQAALMAPTSILAEQHYRGLSETFGKMKADQLPVIALLTSSLTTSERESIYRGLADGSIDIAVGTHALIQEGVDFHDLGLAVIDEQQRFGVDQRGHLRGKGHHPHLLAMTATPIPRTLALTVHADLDLSIIDEKPPGRQAVQTKIIEQAARERLYGFVTAQLEQGRQAFFVHPLIEESESIETASAVEAHERLKRVFFRYRVCLLHGQMNPSEKDRVMADFARGDYDVMAATSVAEVGVDVPNASVMVIEGANRFGLAQLHQFRGRVGRGEHPSFCFLIPDSAPDISIERITAYKEGRLPIEDLSIAERRLAAMEASNDGFYLSEVDWKLRGAGDLLGRQQSGHGQLKMTALMTPPLVELAQREARTLYEEDPALQLAEHRLLAESIASLYDDSGDIS